MKVTVQPNFSEASAHYSEFRRVVRVFFGRKLSAFGLVIIVLFILIGIFAPLLAPYDPYKINLAEQLLQPSREHLLGTDSLGRDTLSRVIYGSRTSLMIGIAAIFIAAVIGEFLGLIAAYWGGMTFNIIMRSMDALMSLPMILTAIVIAVVLGSGIKNVIVALGIGMVAPQARLMCGKALTIKQNAYIVASRAMGASNLRIMFMHIFPNCIPPLIVMLTVQMGMCILAEASLSFLGIGIIPPTATWGGMVAEGYKYVFNLPILAFAPGFAIMLVTFSFNMAGDGLRDALDPRLRGIL